MDRRRALGRGGDHLPPLIAQYGAGVTTAQIGRTGSPGDRAVKPDRRLLIDLLVSGAVQPSTVS
ncbi:hypothetical protein Ari01nite_60520 [Paractinoplanes rishiriensis]|uniref:Uncharacterized protein n=1 Tax=Paractinoplanes rishiriensis TaxID=1050105 RepID=A0A919N245_9ACTN|nr:hypothetical protein Ari01nite_60520 [Actinoplanes rishiriensis]